MNRDHRLHPADHAPPQGYPLERQHGNLEKILASANHLLGLINDVLDLSKIEAGRMELRPVEFGLEPLVDQACARSSRWSGARRCS